MKDDVPPLPELVPKKRVQIQKILDVHLAMWLAGEIITPLERKKLLAERTRRRTSHPDVKLGVIAAPEGMTPPQFKTFQAVMQRIGATEVNHPHLPGKVYHVIKALDVPTQDWGDMGLYDPRAMLRQCTVVVAAPREPEVQSYASSYVWTLVGYAKNRSLPVKVILPDGKEVQ